jgi:hypothetical protein
MVSDMSQEIIRSPRGKAARFWIGLWLALGLLWAGPALAARIDVSLDRNPVPLDQSFTLIFSAEEAPDDDPDFRPLEKDFEVLSQSQSSQFSYQNGHSSRRIEWRVTVIAKEAGTLEIPPVPFGRDRSQPFSVTVVAGSAKRNAPGNAEVFMEVQAEPKEPYVQAQVIYTLRVLSRVAFGEARLSPPKAGDALIEQLGDGQNPSSLVLRNGVQYKMTEIRYALFPQQSGPLRIEPMRLEIQVASGGRSLFAPFFNSPTRAQRVESDAIELQVRPIPAEFKGKHWLPAASLELEDSWAGKPPQVAGGEPVTRALTIKARGVTVGLLPELGPEAAPASDAIKQYPDQPVLSEDKPVSGLSSVRQEKTALVVSRPGTYRLPALEIPWWNIQTDRPEVARLPERTLTVLPSAHGPGPAAPQAAPESKPTPEAAPTPVATPESESRPAARALAEDHWFWLALLCGLGWLATGVAWWRQASRKPSRTEAEPPTRSAAPSERKLRTAIETACRANDAAEAKRALADWAALRWPGSALGGQDLERRAGGGELGREIARLNRCLYGRGGAEWQGEGLLRSLNAHAAREDAVEGSRAGRELEPLHRL